MSFHLLFSPCYLSSRTANFNIKISSVKAHGKCSWAPFFRKSKIMSQTQSDISLILRHRGKEPTFDHLSPHREYDNASANIYRAAQTFVVLVVHLTVFKKDQIFVYEYAFFYVNTHAEAKTCTVSFDSLRVDARFL